MRLYSKEDWFSIPWPNTDEGKRMRSFFEPLFQEGVKNFIGNIQSEIYILHLDDLFIPLTVNEKEYYNSYVCSIYSLLLYAEEEMKRHHRNFLQILLFPFLGLLKLWFRWSKINRIVIVNNFFLSTNLYDSISSDRVEKLCEFLINRFPHHAIIFRSLNTYTEESLIHILHRLGSSFITSRSIYFFDPKYYSHLPSKKRWIIQKDKKLQKQDNIQILKHKNFQPCDALEIKRLYDLLYLEKYSYFNPAFTVRFFERVIKDKTFVLSGIKYKDRLVGVIGFFKKKGIMATPIVGYDTNLPESLGLYRLLTACMLEESLNANVIFHMSAGVGHFKRQRGAFQEIEMMAVLCKHLPFYRQFLWKMLALLFNKIGTFILKKYKL
ncbi:MAG: hypothetical protein ACRDDW_01180 [Candidatus Rhabdochlamydia sp.]